MVSSESFMGFTEASQRLTDLGVINDPYPTQEDKNKSSFYVETFFPKNQVFHFLTTNVLVSEEKLSLKTRLIGFDLNSGEATLHSPSTLLCFAADTIGVKWDEPINFKQINEVLTSLESSDAVVKNFGIPRHLLHRYLTIEAIIRQACHDGKLDKSFLNYITEYTLLEELIGTVMRFALEGTTPDVLSYYAEIPETLLGKIFT